MTFDLRPTAAQHDLARRTHQFAESVIRPVALDYDQRQEFPWPVLEEAAQQGFYSPLFYRDLIGDSTGLSMPMFMEELFWGCAGIGLAIVMPALALSAIGQAASQNSCCSGRRNASARPVTSNSRPWRSPSPRAAATCATCAPRPAATATTG